jgi:hypothetical protein
MELTQTGKIIILETADIGGTNTGATGNWAGYHNVSHYDHITAIVEVGTWNATDDLDTCKLQQYDGTTTKDLTTSASGGDYDTDAPVDADGDQVIFEVPVTKLDAVNGFNQIRLYCAEAGNTGVDNVTGVIILSKARDKKKELHKTAATGSVVYVRT